MLSSSEIRDLYRQACHGAGAEPRLAARKKIQAEVEARGVRLHVMLDEAGVDIGAYFASAPISAGAA